MRTSLFSAILVMAGLLTGCAHIDPHPMDMTAAIRSAKTVEDHQALARHYEAAADDMRSKAQEQKNYLAEYRRHASYYGRVTQDLRGQAHALIRVYEEAAEANMSMAKSHRLMAEETR